MYKKIIEDLLSFPQKRKIQIKFDLKKGIFHLSTPIFLSKRAFPQSVKEYVEATKGRCFKPHATFYEVKENGIFLCQEIPFLLSTLQKEIDLFWKLSQGCHKMLSEIALEEKYRGALYLDSDS